MNKNSCKDKKVHSHSTPGKLIINDMTDISQPSLTEYCFQYAELCTIIADILQNSSEGDSVSVVGKVGNNGEISTVRFGKQTL